MQKSKPLKPRNYKKPIPVNWVEFITDESRKLAIPCGPRFQIDLSDRTGPPPRLRRIKYFKMVGVRGQNIQRPNLAL